MKKNKKDSPQLFTLGERGNKPITRKDFIKSTLKAGTLTILGPSLLLSCEEEEDVEKDIIKSLKYDYIQHSGRSIEDFRLNAAGNTLFTVAQEEIRRWSFPQGSWLGTNKVDYFVSICINSNASMMATGHSDDHVKLWSLPDMELIRTWNSDSIYAESLCFSPDGSILATGGLNNALKLWDVNSGALIHEFRGYDRIRAICFSPDGKFLVSAGNGMNIWNLEDKSIYKSYSGSYRAAAISHDGRYFAAGSTLRTFPECDFLKYLTPTEGSIACLEFSPDNKSLVVGTEIRKRVDGIDRRLGSFHVHSLESDRVQNMENFDNHISKIRFSPNSGILMAGDGMGIVSLFNMPDIEQFETQEYCTCDTICTCNSVTICSCNSDAPCGCNNVCTVNMVCSCNSVCPSDSICQCVSH